MLFVLNQKIRNKWTLNQYRVFQVMVALPGSQMILSSIMQHLEMSPVNENNMFQLFQLAENVS